MSTKTKSVTNSRTLSKTKRQSRAESKSNLTKRKRNTTRKNKRTPIPINVVHETLEEERSSQPPPKSKSEIKAVKAERQLKIHQTLQSIIFDPPSFIKVPEGQSVRDREYEKILYQIPKGYGSLTWPANDGTKGITLRTLEYWFLCMDNGEMSTKIKWTFLMNHYFKDVVKIANGTGSIVYKEYFEKLDGSNVMVLTSRKVNDMRSCVLRWFDNITAIKYNFMLAPDGRRNGGGRTPDLPSNVYFNCYKAM